MNSLKNQQEEVIDLFQLFNELKKHFRLIIIWALIGLILSMVVSFFFITPKYSSTIDILVNQKADSEQTQYTTQQADLQAINTYKDVIQKAVILEPVVKELKQKNNYQGSVGSLQGAISVANQTSSQVFSVTVTDTNAYMAADIANTIGTVFSKKIKQMMKIDNVTIVTKATPNLTPVSPNKKMNALIGLLVGLLIGIGIVVIKYLRDTTVKDVEFLSELGLTNLGIVYHMHGKQGYKVVNILNSKAAPAAKPMRRRV